MMTYPAKSWSKSKVYIVRIFKIFQGVRSKWIKKEKNPKRLPFQQFMFRIYFNHLSKTILLTKNNEEVPF